VGTLGLTPEPNPFPQRYPSPHRLNSGLPDPHPKPHPHPRHEQEPSPQGHKPPPNRTTAASLADHARVHALQRDPNPWPLTRLVSCPCGLPPFKAPEALTLPAARSLPLAERLTPARREALPQSAPLSRRVKLSKGSFLQGTSSFAPSRFPARALPRQRHPDGGHCDPRGSRIGSASCARGQEPARGAFRGLWPREVRPPKAGA
jgi:hypothetical protein